MQTKQTFAESKCNYWQAADVQIPIPNLPKFYPLFCGPHSILFPKFLRYLLTDRQICQAVAEVTKTNAAKRNYLVVP